MFGKHQVGKNEACTCSLAVCFFYRWHNPPCAGALKQSDATVAILETQCEEEAAMESRRLRLEEDCLLFEMKQNNDNVILKEMELCQIQADLEAKTRLKELELQKRQSEQDALSEDRRHNRTHQKAQLEIIKAMFNKYIIQLNIHVRDISLTIFSVQQTV